MTAPAPIRHPAPPSELRLEWPGCWVWAVSDDAWSAVHQETWMGGRGYGVHDPISDCRVLCTRGLQPPWTVSFIDQRDPGDETPDDEGFITVYASGPSEGYTAEGARP